MTDFWKAGIDPAIVPRKVLIMRDTLVDESREGRPVKIKAYHPDEGYEGQTLPVIFWSHGLGGGVDGAAFLSRFLAAHGYIVVHLQHLGTDTTIWEGKPGHPWDVIRQTPITRDMTLNRYKDEPFVLDALPGWLATQEMNVIPDLDTIGMSGHSFGALTTQVMAGMLFPDKNQSLESFQEPRFTAGIAYSPGDISHLNVNDEKQAYQAICLPLLHMTGTEDRSPLTDDGYEIRLKAYQNSPAIDGKHLLVISEADHMVFAGSRGKLGQNPNREKHEQIIRVAALSYWDAMLKNDKAAQDWLTGGGFSAWLDGEGTFQ